MRNHQTMHARSGRGPDYPLTALFEGDEYSHHARYEGEWPSVRTRCGRSGAPNVIEPQHNILCPTCHKLEQEGA